MNKTIIFVLICVSLTFSQSIHVVDRKQVTHQEDRKFYFPLFSPDDGKILVTSAKYRGLWYLDLNNNSVLQINDHAGSGYQPVFTNDGEKIFFKKNVFEKGKKYSSLHAYNLKTKKESLIRPESRELMQIKIRGDNLVCRQGSTIQQINGKTNNIIKSSNISSAVVFPDGNGLIVEDSKGFRSISPVGKGHYIWSSVSPDKKRLLFTVAGRGTFITDLNGDLIANLGRAHAPKWSPDGRWVVYMDDRDDGDRYISSTINVIKSDASERIILTTGENLAMHPNWSYDGQRIVYHTLEGEIHLLILGYGDDIR